MSTFRDDHYYEDRFNEQMRRDYAVLQGRTILLEAKLNYAQAQFKKILNIIDAYPHIAKNVYVGLIAHEAEEGLNIPEAAWVVKDEL